MPLEIRELHIRVTVNDPGEGGGKPGPSGAAAKPGGVDDADKNALITQCVEETLRIIHDEEER